MDDTVCHIGRSLEATGLFCNLQYALTKPNNIQITIKILMVKKKVLKKSWLN